MKKNIIVIIVVCAVFIVGYKYKGYRHPNNSQSTTRPEVARLSREVEKTIIFLDEAEAQNQFLLRENYSQKSMAKKYSIDSAFMEAQYAKLISLQNSLPFLQLTLQEQQVITALGRIGVRAQKVYFRRNM